LDSSRATKGELPGVDATAIGAAQNLPNRNAASAEGLSDALGVRYPAGRKVYFLRAVAWRVPGHPFSDVNVSVAQ
jgi:hypothetical protein